MFGSSTVVTKHEMRKQVDNQKQKPIHGTKKPQTENNNQEQ